MIDPATAIATGKKVLGWLLKPVVIVGMLLAVQTVRIEGFWFIDGFKPEVASLTQTIKDKNAEIANLKRVITEAEEKRDAALTRADNLAKEIDRDRAALEAGPRANADAYRRRMQCTPARPATSTSPAETDTAPEGGDGPGVPPEYIAVSRNDFDILVENSLRLEAVKRWGDKMVQDKLAIPEVEFGK